VEEAKVKSLQLCLGVTKDKPQSSLSIGKDRLVKGDCLVPDPKRKTPGKKSIDDVLAVLNRGTEATRRIMETLDRQAKAIKNLNEPYRKMMERNEERFKAMERLFVLPEPVLKAIRDQEERMKAIRRVMDSINTMDHFTIDAELMSYLRSEPRGISKEEFDAMWGAIMEIKAIVKELLEKEELSAEEKRLLNRVWKEIDENTRSYG